MNELDELIKNRNRIADEIGDLLSHRDSINSDIADLRDRLQELNDDIESTKEEDEFFEILKSDDYSSLAREYRRLNRKINEGRTFGWHMDGSDYSLEGEIRQQRRDIGDRMHEVELKEFELNEK